MKFKQTEHDAFKNKIEQLGLNYLDFTFTKKKGWLSIQHELTKTPFAFHRKTETSLNKDGTWRIQNHYFTLDNGIKTQFDSFESILNHFRLWLRQIHV